LKSLRFSGWVCFAISRSRHQADPHDLTSSRMPHPRIETATLFRLALFCHFTSLLIAGPGHATRARTRGPRPSRALMLPRPAFAKLNRRLGFKSLEPAPACARLRPDRGRPARLRVTASYCAGVLAYFPLNCGVIAGSFLR
jgi:hypothetical protein